jgi:hypothetical protein
MLTFLFALTSLALAIDSPAPILPETVVIPSGKLRLKAFLWKPSGARAFSRGSLLSRVGWRRRRSHGWAPNHGSCLETCATVSKTRLRISLPVSAGTRPFSRSRPVHARHLAAQRSNERETSSPAFAVHAAHHRSSRLCRS